jgi:hypothetical protein
LLKLLAFVIEHNELAHSGLVKTIRDVVVKLCRMEITLAARAKVSAQV